MLGSSIDLNLILKYETEIELEKIVEMRILQNINFPYKNKKVFQNIKK